MGKTIITYGLPGSGKTYYGEQLQQNGCMTVINMDDHMEDGNYKSLKKVLKETLKKRHYILNDIYIDALITTRDNLIKTIDELHKFFLNENPEYRKYGKSFKIVYWDENREACRKNAERRNDGRNVSVTIDNLPYETFKESSIENRIHSEIDLEIKVTFEKRKVYMENSVWHKHFQKLIDTTPIWKKEGVAIFSESWSLGGSWGDCWGNSGTISPEEQPETCEMFDNLLLEVCPAISFLQYKILQKECVSIDKYSESDYYGGTEYYARYKFDVKKCYDWLREKELIEI